MSDQWLPYFGNQYRFRRFAAGAILDRVPTRGVVAETNAGSHAISFTLQRAAMRTIANDISPFSEAIGHSLYGDIDSEPHLANASYGCAAIETQGYDLSGPPPEPSTIRKWEEWFRTNRRPNEEAVITRMDVFDFLKSTKGDLVYMDFAWPWRDEDRETVEEYGVMVDQLGSIIAGEEITMERWTRFNIIDHVLEALQIASQNFGTVLLSNQSSNWPTHEVLLDALGTAGWLDSLAYARTLTMEAEDVDNRGLDRYFTEYQYVFDGAG